MLSHQSSQPRPGHPTEAPVGQSHTGSPSSLSIPEQQEATHTSCHKEFAQCPSGQQHDWPCPVCLQTASFPVQTNCGHLFCAPCLIAYWRHGSWLDAVSCPLCRQKVSVLCRLFNESSSDRQSKEVLGEITNYNKRYSGVPRKVTDYLRDVPLLLQLLARGLGTMGALVWLFFLRVALCCIGTVLSIFSLPLEPASSSASPLETDTSLHGLLGILDDLVAVILLLMCIITVNQHMTQERHSASTTTTHRVMGNSQ
ncbi:hypothetical protein LDENG_00065780 [Lucifuga dentata]|nr:hypothetical protein LDENG_00065780 [Lucifuga dentata]